MLAERLGAHAHPGATNEVKCAQVDLGMVLSEAQSMVQLPLQTFPEYENNVGCVPVGPLSFR